MRCSLKERPFVLRFICRRPDSHTRFFLFSFSSVGDVAFSEYFFCVVVFSLYGEYVVRSFLPDGVFLPRDHNGLDYVRIQSIKKNTIIILARYYSASLSRFGRSGVNNLAQSHSSPSFAPWPDCIDMYVLRAKPETADSTIYNIAQQVVVESIVKARH